MPFYRIDIGNRMSAVVYMTFGRKAGPAPCQADAFEFDEAGIFTGKCGRPSSKLCDAPAGTDLGGRTLTCDMPICVKHATRGGEHVDYCPHHAHLAPAGIAPPADGDLPACEFCKRRVARLSYSRDDVGLCDRCYELVAEVASSIGFTRPR